MANDDPPLRLLLSIDEAAAALSIDRSNLYKLLNRGELRSVVVGKRRRLIPVAALEEYVDALAEA